MVMHGFELLGFHMFLTSAMLFTAKSFMVPLPPFHDWIKPFAVNMVH